ncbi:hypothetical protein BDV93DRAFT_517269 [Ceratobasidium sp. AG-I]|nr:hypothetical protein BDV93DRAFT_517269 [Ceratobasidium sp. AG-I]
MFSFTPRSLTAVLAYTVLLTSVMSAPIPQGQGQQGEGQQAQQGQPLSVGQAASPTAQASTTFGTTTDAPNFKNSPTGVCIVPALASDAGFGTAKVPLTNEQALQLCPNATRIVVQAQTGKRGIHSATGQAGNTGNSNGQAGSQPTNTGNAQQGNGQVGNSVNGNNGATPVTTSTRAPTPTPTPASSNSGTQSGNGNSQTGSGSTLGKPLSVGKAATPTAQASTIFGTTTSSPNFSSSPTGVCIVPMFANEAGLGSDKTPLTNQQALELCPNATNIVVCST